MLQALWGAAIDRPKRNVEFSRLLLAAALFGAVGAWPHSAAAAEQRVALVIGNSAYPSSRLRNPVNDANAMADKLRAPGFDVILRTDVNLRDMTRSFSYAMGTENKGNIIWGGGYGLRSPASASESALEQCQRGAGDSCKLVMLNSDFREKEFTESAQQLGSKIVAAVRQAFLQSLRRDPTEFTLGLGGNSNVVGGRSMGFTSIRE